MLLLCAGEILGIHKPVLKAVDPNDCRDQRANDQKRTQDNQNNVEATKLPSRISQVTNQATNTNCQGPNGDPTAVGLGEEEYDGNNTQKEDDAESTGNAVNCRVGVCIQQLGNIGMCGGESEILQNGDCVGRTCLGVLVGPVGGQLHQNQCCTEDGRDK